MIGPGAATLLSPSVSRKPGAVHNQHAEGVFDLPTSSSPMRPSDDGVRDADREERRPPAAPRVGGQLHVPPLVRHARDDEPDPRPRVQPVVNEPQLRRLVAQEHGSERRTQAAAAGGDV
jgi:hypothetical protein